MLEKYPSWWCRDQHCIRDYNSAFCCRFEAHPVQFIIFTFHYVALLSLLYHSQLNLQYFPLILFHRELFRNEGNTSVLICSRGGGGLLLERMELVAELWEEKIKVSINISDIVMFIEISG